MAVLLTLATSCSGGSGKTNTNGTGPTAGGGAPPKSGELDKLMRTRMNVSYSQLVYLVFHAEGGPDFDAISAESAKLTEAVSAVLALQPPPVVQSDQARSVYVDYNETLRKDNEKFVEATSSRNINLMSSSLTKIGETCSACHHFFRIEIK